MDRLKYVLDRLREPTTWAGISIVSGIVGRQISPENQVIISGFFDGLAAAIFMFWKRDSQSVKKTE